MEELASVIVIFSIIVAIAIGESITQDKFKE